MAATAAARTVPAAAMVAGTAAGSAGPAEIKAGGISTTAAGATAGTSTRPAAADRRRSTIGIPAFSDAAVYRRG